MSKTFSFSTIVAALVIAAVAVFGFATLVHANPFYAGSPAKSAVATTTVSYLTPGTATSTTVYDSYEQNGTNEVNKGDLTFPTQVAVAVQGNASSTSSVLGITCEFSDDRLDWYSNEIFPASTSNPVLIAQANNFSMVYASTTVGGVGNTPRYQKLVVCPVPLRYVRAILTDTGANLSVWSAIYPTKQRN